jgi:hypothetical protein
VIPIGVGSVRGAVDVLSVTIVNFIGIQSVNFIGIQSIVNFIGIQSLRILLGLLPYPAADMRPNKKAAVRTFGC